MINEEIAKTISNIVDFEVFFQEDGNKLDVLIKHPNYEARPIEMGSGAEKNACFNGHSFGSIISVFATKR